MPEVIYTKHSVRVKRPVIEQPINSTVRYIALTQGLWTTDAPTFVSPLLPRTIPIGATHAITRADIEEFTSISPRINGVLALGRTESSTHLDTSVREKKRTLPIA